MKCQYNSGLNRKLVYDNPQLGKQLVEQNRGKPNSCNEEATEAMGVGNHWRVCAKHATLAIFNRLRKRMLLRGDTVICKSCGSTLSEPDYKCMKCEKLYQKDYHKGVNSEKVQEQRELRQLEKELAERYGGRHAHRSV